MIFHMLLLTDDGKVSAQAQGHANDVVTAFHSVCSLLLSERGPWRITEVKGSCPDDTDLDSNMEWTLAAKLKNI